MKPNPIWPLLMLCAALASPAFARAEGPTVTTFVACADVADKECVGEAQRFGLDVGTLWAYAVIDNRGEPLPIEMVWRRDGDVVFTAELTVGRSRRWRTWSRKRVRASDRGAWTVAVQRADDPHGAPLAVIAFAVGDAAIPPAEVPQVQASPADEDAPPDAAPDVRPTDVPPDMRPTDAPPAMRTADAPPEVGPDDAPPAMRTADAPPKVSPDDAPPAIRPPATPLDARETEVPPAAPADAPQATPAPPSAPDPGSDPAPEAAPEPPAAPPAPDPPPATPAPAAAPDPTPAPAPVASTPPSADTICRGWVNIRQDGADGPIYQTLDVRIGPRTVVETAPGLVVGGPDGLHALAMARRTVREASPGGLVDRSWDMLLGRGLSQGQRRVWAGFPATMAPPERGEAPHFEQHHPLVVRSIIGPYVGVEATLEQRGPRDARQRGRAMTVRAAGAPPHPLDRESAMQAAFARLPKAKRPDPANVDPALYAVMEVKGRAVARAIAPCCGREKGDAVSVEMPFDPAVLDPGVDADWRFVGPEGCAVHRKGGRIRATRGGSSTAIGPKGAVLLGVTWVPVNHPHRAARQQRAVQRLR